MPVVYHPAARLMPQADASVPAPVLEAFADRARAVDALPRDAAGEPSGSIWMLDISDLDWTQNWLRGSEPVPGSRIDALRQSASRAGMGDLADALGKLEAEDAVGDRINAMVWQMANTQAPAIMHDAGIMGFGDGEAFAAHDFSAYAGKMSLQGAYGEMYREVGAALSACVPSSGDVLEAAIARLPRALQGQARRASAALSAKLNAGGQSIAINAMRRVLGMGIVAGSQRKSEWTERTGADAQTAVRFVEMEFADRGLDLSGTDEAAREWAALKGDLSQLAEGGPQADNAADGLAALNAAAKAQFASVEAAFGRDVARPLANLHMALYAIARDTPALDGKAMADALVAAGNQALAFRRFDAFGPVVEHAMAAADPSGLGAKLLAAQAPQAFRAFAGKVAADNAAGFTGGTAELAALRERLVPGDMLADNMLADRAGALSDGEMARSAAELRHAPASVQGSFLALADRLADMEEGGGEGSSGAGSLRRGLGLGVQNALRGDFTLLDYALNDAAASIADPVAARFLSGGQKRLRQELESLMRLQGQLPCLPNGRSLKPAELQCEPLVNATLALAQRGDRPMAQALTRALTAIDAQGGLQADRQPGLRDFAGRLVEARLADDAPALRAMEAEMRRMDGNSSNRRLVDALGALLAGPSTGPAPSARRAKPKADATVLERELEFPAPANRNRVEDEDLQRERERARGPELSR